MKNKMRFKDLEDLYNSVLPALMSKENNLHLEKYVMITKDDIWNYLLEKKWVLQDELDLASIIDDILCVDGYKVSEYVNMRKVLGGNKHGKKKK